MAHRTAHDAAQDVTATLVGGHHAIGDEETGRAEVVGNHAVVRVAGAVRGAVCGVSTGLDQAAHEVGVVVVVLALQERADAFQPHAGVDRLHVEVTHCAVFELFVLHEDEVPDLDKPVAVFLWAARGTAPDVVAVVVEDFRGRAAGAGGPHAPEIVVRGDADDAVFGDTDLAPEVECLVVGVVNGRQEAAFVDAEVLGDQLPRKRDRL